MVSKKWVMGTLTVMERDALGMAVYISVDRLAIEMMFRFDRAHRARLAAHHDGMRFRAAGEEADAAQHVAVGDAGRGEHHLALRQLVGGEDLGEVLHPHLGRARF